MPGSPNFRFVADLTVKGATRSIEFPGIVAEVEDGTITAIAQMEIDRTRWNVLYGSGRFYRMLGKHLVSDSITLLLANSLIFAAVGVGNILLPPLVKKYFPDRIGLMTTIYSTTMAVATFTPPLIAVPVADAAGWRRQNLDQHRRSHQP